jgi:hypothetical protein
VPNPLFREDALERLKSPAQLNDAMQVVSSSAWLALVGCALFIIAAVIWAFTAHLPVKIDAYGTLENTYVSILDAPRIKPGMKAEMILSHVRSEQHGHLLAHVGGVAEHPALDAPDYVRKLLQVTPVQITLVPTTKWTGPSPTYRFDQPDIFFHALITVDFNRPIDYVTPIFKRIISRD